MRINSINNISFKGYDAAPIKNLYMLSFADRAQKNVRKDLYEIGKRENFDVLVEEKDELYKDLQESKMNYMDTYKWSQDNKVFINSENGNYLLTSADQRIFNHKGQLHKILGLEQKDSRVIFAGGNVFLGKKPDGEKYILVGNDVILDTAIREYLTDLDCWYGNDKDIRKFKDIEEEREDKISFYSKSEYPRPTKKDFREKEEIYTERVKQFISEDFDVKKENIFVVPQQIFHLDMFIRPIGYPYVLVNSEEEAQNLVDNELGLKENETDLPNQTYKYYRKQNKENKGISTQDVVTALKSQGFEPIEVGGIFGLDGMVNFINSVVNKHEDGSLTYITNSSACDLKDYTLLEKKFAEQLKQKVPNIKKAYFIDGGRAGNINLMMENIWELSGGLHCLVCEEPNFEAWG